MGRLQDIVSDPSTRRDVIRDAEIALAEEVAGKRGISGLAVKGAYKVLTKLRPGIVPLVIDALLDEFVAALDLVLDDHEAAGGTPPLREYMLREREAAADRLLAITDRRAAEADIVALRKLYKRLRPAAKGNVEDGMPRIAGLILRYLPGE